MLIMLSACSISTEHQRYLNDCDIVCYLAFSTIASNDLWLGDIFVPRYVGEPVFRIVNGTEPIGYLQSCIASHGLATTMKYAKMATGCSFKFKHKPNNLV